MSDAFLSSISITDKDIAWAESTLGLPPSAFDEPRRQVLKTMGSLDVSSCPGSGKTTMVVAKLAILTRKWPYRTKGICVLSHTNVARHEIETRLGHTNEGGALLEYPHFVGTIDSFVDTFLAIPWLKSLHKPITLIDTEICTASRWRKLPYKAKIYCTEHYLDQAVMVVKDLAFKLNVSRLREETLTYQMMKEACQQSIAQGNFCYEEMYLWAEDLLSKYPSFAINIQKRFPFLLIDEAQDNRSHQTSLLNKLFFYKESFSIHQRFGDPDQAIYDFTSESDETLNDFPSTKFINIPNSHRFGQAIAHLANNLGTASPHLEGTGPSILTICNNKELNHTIFLFSEDSVGKVLPAFGHLLISSFTDAELAAGVFKAIGYIHNPKQDNGKKHFPHDVKDYWNEYMPSITQRDANPRFFVGYIIRAQSMLSFNVSISPAIERLCEGIMRLARSLHGTKPLPNRRYLHRYIEAALEKNEKSKKDYLDFLYTFLLQKKSLQEEDWNFKWLPLIKRIASAIANEEWKDNEETTGFLRWPSDSEWVIKERILSNNDNIFSYIEGGRKANIKVGSIHSIKGETHTATLVLETFMRKNNLKDLLPYLGDSNRGKGKNPTQRLRMRVHYVAMTRPTHLLCLAMKAEDVQPYKENLEAYGWRIESL